MSEGARAGRAGREQERPARPALALFLAAAPLALYALRELDDNRLTSWAWILEGTSPGLFAAAVLAALALAWWLAGRGLPQRLSPPLLFASLFLLLAPLWRTPEVILDAARYFTYSQYAAEHGLAALWREWGRGLPVWSDLPSAPFLYGLVHILSGGERLAFQALNTALFALTALLARGLGRLLWSESVGALAGVLMAAFPYALAQTPLLLADVPAMFFLTLSLYALARLCLAEPGGGEAGWAAVLGAALATAAAWLAKYSLWPLYLAALLMPWAWAAEARRRRLWLAALLGAGALLACFLLLKREVFLAQLGLLGGYQWSGLDRWGESLVSTFLFQTHPLVTLAALYSLYAAARRRDRRYLVILALAALALGLGGRRSRYILPALPLLALLAAYGLAELRPARARGFAALAAALTSLALALCFQLPFLEGVSLVNLRQAGRHLDSLKLPEARVITAPAQGDLYDPAVCLPLLGLYARTPLCYENALSRRAPQRDVSRSSLRFTWEYRAPAGQVCPPEGAGPGQALVVVAESPELPPAIRARLQGYRLERAFETHEGVFALLTMVYLYLPEKEDGAAGISPGPGAAAPGPGPGTARD